MNAETSRKLFEQIIACATDAMITVDSEQRIVLFNPAASTMFRVRAEEALGQPLDRFIPERARAAHTGHIAQVGRTGVRGRRMGGFAAVTGLRANGEEFPLEASISQVEVAGQKLYTAIMRDISERKRAEELLQETGQRLGLAVQTARLGMYERDLRNNKIHLNDVCREVLGLAAEEDPGAEIAVRSLYPEDKERVLAAVARAFDPALREVCGAEFRVLRPDGTVRWVEGRGRVVFDDTVAPPRPQKFLGVLLDITERKLVETELTQAKQEVTLINAQLEQRVKESTAELQETMAELEHMSYSMIHDMRAPLRAVRSFAGLLEHDAQLGLSEGALQLLRRMQMAAERMDQLLTGALNYNRALRNPLPVGPANVYQILQDLLALYPEFRPPQAEILLESGFAWVRANEAALSQCFAELLRNGIKFVEPGKVPRIRVWAERVQAPPQPRCPLRSRDATDDSLSISGWVRLWFEDNGTGIPDFSRRKIFNLFERMHGPEYPGTGVGLALVRKLIGQMGGALGVESKDGGGSRFWVALPCPPEERERQARLAA